MRKTGQMGMNLIKYFEGLRLKAYKDTGGVWTIGYGHTKGVKKGMVITEEEAEEFLRQDLLEAEKAVNRLVPYGLAQHQFDALVSLVFNIGTGAFKNSTLLRMMILGDILGASKQFGRWVYDNGERLKGLIERREAERKLFLIG